MIKFGIEEYARFKDDIIKFFSLMVSGKFGLQCGEWLTENYDMINNNTFFVLAICFSPIFVQFKGHPLMLQINVKLQIGDGLLSSC